MPVKKNASRKNKPAPNAASRLVPNKEEAYEKKSPIKKATTTPVKSKPRINALASQGKKKKPK